MQKVTIHLKSFHQPFLKNSVNYILDISRSLKIKEIHLFYLPTKKKVYTLGRSPHIDKKSREQFERRRYKGQILVVIKSTLKTSLLLYFLKNFLWPGVELEISLEFLDFYPSGHLPS